MNNPIVFQRVEALAVFIIATLVYFYSDFSLLYYVLLLFIFDVFVIGYLAGPRAGAIVYNLGHSFIIPSMLIGVYLLTGNNVILGLSCLWFAHIGLDRALGYGLKNDSGFKHTHLGDIGKK